MKRYFICTAILLIIFSLFLTSCSRNNIFGEKKTEEIFHKITIHTNNESYEISVKNGEKITALETPQKTNHLFAGWYTDANFNNKFNLDTEIYYSLSLYAKFNIDATKLSSKINKEILPSIVTVKFKSFNTKEIFGFDTDEVTKSETHTGTGVIIASNQSQTHYFVLTTSYVGQIRQGYSKRTLTITDNQGNIYDGTVMKVDSKYGLSRIDFYSRGKKFETVPLAQNAPEIKDSIISICSKPLNIQYSNAYTYNRPSIENIEEYLYKMKFSLLVYTASNPTNDTGDVLLNSKLEIIGIHCFNTTMENQGYAIPVNQIQQFLEEHIINKYDPLF